MKMRERVKLERNLSGIANMPRTPGAMFVVDIRRERIAVAEARRLGIPIIAMVDSNCNPDLVNHVIPCNDDARKSIEAISLAIAAAVREGKKSAVLEAERRKAEQEKRAQAEA